MTAQELERLRADNATLHEITERLRATRDWLRTGLDTLIDDRPYKIKRYMPQSRISGDTVTVYAKPPKAPKIRKEKSVK